MTTVRYHRLVLLSGLVAAAPVGTNRGLLHMLWMPGSGALLVTRGAVIPGLRHVGLPDTETRRAWAAVAHGKWTIDQVLTRWRTLVQEAGPWCPRTHAGYVAVAVDMTAVVRPRLQGCRTTHDHAAAGRALPAIPLEVVARTAMVAAQRLRLPLALVRADPDDAQSCAHERTTPQRALTVLDATDVLVVDRGFSLRLVQESGAPRSVVRLTKTATARPAPPPVYGGRGRRPTRGSVVRPLARRRRGSGMLAATPPAATTGTVWVFHDPRYAEPLVVATTPALPARVVLALERDRWPVEQLPLAAEQLIGAGRQFVHAAELCQRLPAVALLAGAILSYAAAAGPARPTGGWVRRPRRTPGRRRRVLAQTGFPHDMPSRRGFAEQRPSPVTYRPASGGGRFGTADSVESCAWIMDQTN